MGAPRIELEPRIFLCQLSQADLPITTGGTDMRLNLRVKLLLAFLSVMLCTTFTGLFGWLSLTRVSSLASDAITRVQPANTEISDVLAGLYEEHAFLRGYVLTGDVSDRLRAEAASASLNPILTSLRGRLRDPADLDVLDTVVDLKMQYDDLMTTVAGYMASGDIEEASLKLQSQGTDLIEQATAVLTGLKANQQTETDDLTAQVAELTRFGMWVVAGATGVGILLGLILALIQSGRISRPVRAMAAAARALSAGDLTVQLPAIKSRDEVGELAAAFAQMVQDLRTLVKGITGSAASTHDASERLAAAAEQSARSAQESAEAMGRVAEGTSQQSEDVEAVTQTVAELQASIRGVTEGSLKMVEQMRDAGSVIEAAQEEIEAVSDRTREIASKTDQARAAARQGAQVVENAVASLDRIQEVVGQSARQIRNLAQISTKVGEITGVISEIAEQTNLLALNAAIEAARAGQHGRGFAVVAEEVRKLAERSAASASDIAQLVENIQLGTAEAVKAMESGMAEVEAGSRMAADAGQGLQEIITLVDRAVDDLQNISEATDQIRRRTQEVTRAFEEVVALTEENSAAAREMDESAAHVTQLVTNVSSISQSNAAAAQQIAAAIEELNATAEEVAAAAQQMSVEAQQMQQQVARFKV